MYEIHKGVPIPPIGIKAKKRTKYRAREPISLPLGEMDVGDCFFYAGEAASQDIAARAAYHANATAKLFTVRTLPDKIGIWRIA